MTSETVLITQPKSAMRDDVRQAVQSVREQGHALRVLLPYDPSDSDRLIREVVASGTTRIIAGGGDGTLNAVANALMKLAMSAGPLKWVCCRLAQPMILREELIFLWMIWANVCASPARHNRHPLIWELPMAVTL